MGSPSELSLDYKPIGGYSTAKKPFGDHQPDQPQQLEEFLARLEEERLKIEAFKRELPLCMELLNNAMESCRQQLEMHHTNQGPGPVLEEFIPLKHATNTTDVPDKTPPPATVPCEKASWMTSAQLWSSADGTGGVKKPVSPLHGADDGGLDVIPKFVLDNKQRNGGAFLPFTRDRGGRGRGVLPELALAPVEKDQVEENKCSDADVARREGCGAKGGGGAPGAEQGQGAAAPAPNAGAEGGQAAVAQAQRKARRCWSPDLHRRFVNALQMLGGSQVATPKQIRELMKVDGLTNDEVKSHLQKYRLHTRRPIPAPHSAASAAAPHLVVLGGIWVPQEYATTATAAAPGIYGGHPPPAHYCAGPVPQDFYSPPPQAAHHHHHLHHPPPQHHRSPAAAALVPSGGACKLKHESPEPVVRGSGDNSESIEDGEEEAEEEEEEEGGRSDSSSWKGEDEKALVPVRDRDGEVSNSSDVALEF